MFLPIHALAYTGDGGMGARETQKPTSSGKKLPSRMNVPPHSFSVSIKCWSELQGTFPTCQQNELHTSGNDYKLRPIFKLPSQLAQGWHCSCIQSAGLSFVSMRAKSKSQPAYESTTPRQQEWAMGCFDIFVCVTRANKITRITQ
jgi:hypothetical protein